MDLGLKNRAAIVAASSTGLGRAIAEALAAEGVHLALCARDNARLQSTAADLARTYGIPVWARALDVTDSPAVTNFVQAAAEKYGRLDICVSNAGGPPAAPFAQTTLGQWRAACELNLISHVAFAQAALPLMQKRQWGRFLMITSMSVKQPIENMVLSNTVRAAVLGLTRSLANEYGADNILVHNLGPGYTLTDRLRQLAKGRAAAGAGTEAAILAEWAGRTALGRLGEPREFAAAAVFLCSELASYITGQTLLVDGGMYRGL